jgi:hypothetical protein
MPVLETELALHAGGAALGEADYHLRIIRRVWQVRRARSPRWGDNAVSSCRSYSRAKGPGTIYIAGAFPVALSLSGEGTRGPPRGARGCRGTPGTP